MHSKISISVLRMSLFGKSRQLNSSECASVFMFLLLLLISLIYTSESFSTLYTFAQNDFFLFDFQLRYNEVRCLLSGVDPFRIWRGDVSLSPFSPWHWGCANTGWHEYVHAYPPWAYSFFLPFALLPKHVAALCWMLVNILCAIFLYSFAFFYGRRTTSLLWMRLMPVVAALPILASVCECLGLLNYGLVIAVSILVMALCLNRDNQFLAGVCLSFAMVKPQMGLLFVVPLLIGGKFKAVSCGMAICILVSVLPASLCGESVIGMVLSIKEYASAYSEGDLPTGVFLSGQLPFLSGWLSGFGNMALNAFVGIVSCAVLSWLFRNDRNWLVRLIPASVLCVMWTVSRRHDYCVYIIPFSILARMVIDKGECLDVAAACFLPYFYLIISRGIGLHILLPVSCLVCAEIVVAGVALYAIWDRPFVRNMLLVTMPMALCGSCVESLDMSIWSLGYLLMVSCMSVSYSVKSLLLLSLCPVLFLRGGGTFPPQTIGWTILTLLFFLGIKLSRKCR